MPASCLRSLVFRCIIRCLAAFVSVLLAVPAAPSQASQAPGKASASSPTMTDAGASHTALRDAWLLRGRVVPGKSSAELRRRAYETKLKMRAQRAQALSVHNESASSGSWTVLGPVPLASDASGNGTQDYRQVAGRATAIAIDPADPSGNTVYIAGAQSGVWKSANAAAASPNGVAWTALTDAAATLSIGALAIQPGNTNPANSLILAATGEADDSSDSYFGLGILRSTNAGGSWNLISSANGGALSFNGLGGTRMAFSASTPNTVVAAMAVSPQGLVDGSVNANTMPGLYTSLDGGQTWTYDALTDPGGATDATSATSVVYNAAAGQFFAAIRYHGFYSSPDGVNWTRLANQPAGTLLSATACPPVSTSNSQTCPLYRAEISVVPGRNEMYVWLVYFSPAGVTIDGGIWQSLNGGTSWASISDASIANCGDPAGCGVGAGSYDLALAAVPNGTGTDLYAGSTNLYKCSINTQNPTCASQPFMNLTHAFGCDPVAAPAHVHPAQHAIAFAIPASGSDSGNDLMYFANDGGIYRALDGFGGLTTGSCTGTNNFDDLNQNLGPMTQFVSFAEHPSDPNTLLGGAQGNGSPATNQATTNSSWENVLGGDGSCVAIDPNTPTNFYASNPDIPPGGLGIQLCPDGVSCVDSSFAFVVTSSAVGGDDGAFYFPYVLDPQSTSAMLVGTCRVWRGPRSGGTFTVLSPNFDTLGSGTCSGSEINTVRALAAGGTPDGNGSSVIYATTDGLGPINGLLTLPTGGHVWVTTDATAGLPAFGDTTNNGPQGDINPGQFPISGVAVDSSDGTGKTAYVTVMGFTGGPGHVWQTTNAGASWADYTGNLPDAPVNAVVVDPVNAEVYVGTDVGVFVSPTNGANWTEVGPTAVASNAGFLPNVAVTELELFNSGGEELLRASTYGRGIWQYAISAPAPDFQLTISNSPLTAFSGQLGAFIGAANSENGYASPVTLSCVAGSTAPPTTCTPETPVTPGNNGQFTVSVGGVTGDYSFYIQGVGSDPLSITQQVPVTLQIVSFALTAPTPTTVTVPRGTTSSAVSFQVTAAGTFNQSVAISCTTTITNAVCNMTPGVSVTPTASNPVLMTASVNVPASTPPGSYPVTIQASTAGAGATVTAQFVLQVTTNPDFVLTEPAAFPEVNVGSTGTSGPIVISAQDGFAGTVGLSCATTYGANSCSISPATVNTYPATATLVINGTSFLVGNYSLSIAGVSGATTHTIAVPFNVGDYSITGTQSLSLSPGAQGTANLILTSEDFYAGTVNATCDASALSGAMCVLSPGNPLTVASGGSASLTVTLNVPNSASTGQYNINIHTQDTTGAPAHTFVISVTVNQDFTLTSATPSQTVSPGQTSGPYNLVIQPVGTTYNAAISLTCASGLPAGSQCLFAPSTPITPNNTAVDVVLSITTTGPSSTSISRGERGPLLYGMFFLGITLAAMTSRSRTGKRRIKGRRRISMLIPVWIGLSVFLSCSGVSSGGGNQSATPPGTYQIKVTGTSSSTPPDAHSAQVILVVN